MLDENEYIEMLKNCAKGNERINLQRKTATQTFDLQTRTIQKKTLRREPAHRYTPTDPLQAVVYRAPRWKRNPNPTTDDIEHKYFVQCNPAIHEAYKEASGATTNAANGGVPSNENSNDAISVATPDNRRVSARNAVSTVDYEDFDDFPLDDVEDDGSDEDDWGAKKKRGGGSRKNGAKTSSRRSAVSSVQRQQYMATPPPLNSGAESKPFACQLCPAKYKSRPGLNYHKQHVHGESSTPPGSSSIDSTRSSAGAVANWMSPDVEISTTCSQCQGDKTKNPQNKPETLVSCHDCGASVHPSCLKFTENMILSTNKYGWQCIECKSCAICGTSDNDDKLLFCDDCDRGMHLYCLKPPLEKTPEDAWSCHLCQKEFGARASMPLKK
uniref:PHD finger protein 10 n=1 Tax=Steinernema glaseri TaxID=37863 RepID=A0A1I8A465_9BILA